MDHNDSMEETNQPIDMGEYNFGGTIVSKKNMPSFSISKS
jgi:hypothetical protein